MSEMTHPLNSAEIYWKKRHLKKIQEIIDRIIESRKSLRPKDFDVYLKNMRNHG